MIAPWWVFVDTYHNVLSNVLWAWLVQNLCLLSPQAGFEPLLLPTTLKIPNALQSRPTGSTELYLF